MAKIKISDLSPVGSELFRDSESFLNELQADEMEAILGYGGLQLRLLLKILHHYSVAYNGWLHGHSIQTAFSNGVNGNSHFRGINRNTAIGHSINGITIGNINTV